MARRRSAPTPAFQPVSALPALLALVGELGAALHHHAAIVSVARKTGTLIARRTVTQITSVCTESLDVAVFCDQQIAHWQQDTLDVAQRHDVDRLVAQLATVRTLCQTVSQEAAQLSSPSRRRPPRRPTDT